MAPSITVCSRYEKGSTIGIADPSARYFAVTAASELPDELRSDDRVVDRGYAVHCGNWIFFRAIEPATAFARAARMSTDCSSDGVYEAATDLVHCDRHGDETALLVGRASASAPAEELARLTRFVRGVEENPMSARWREPTSDTADPGVRPTITPARQATVAAVDAARRRLRRYAEEPDATREMLDTVALAARDEPAGVTQREKLAGLVLANYERAVLDGQERTLIAAAIAGGAEWDELGATYGLNGPAMRQYYLQQGGTPARADW
jgi:hypothetical protein